MGNTNLAQTQDEYIKWCARRDRAQFDAAWNTAAQNAAYCEDGQRYVPSSVKSDPLTWLFEQQAVQMKRLETPSCWLLSTADLSADALAQLGLTPAKREDAALTRAMHRMEQIKPQPGSTMASRVAMATWQQCWEAVFGEDKPAQACEGLGRVAK